MSKRPTHISRNPKLAVLSYKGYFGRKAAKTPNQSLGDSVPNGPVWARWVRPGPDCFCPLASHLGTRPGQLRLRPGWLGSEPSLGPGSRLGNWDRSWHGKISTQALDSVICTGLHGKLSTTWKQIMPSQWKQMELEHWKSTGLTKLR